MDDNEYKECTRIPLDCDWLTCYLQVYEESVYVYKIVY